ncbi:PTS sugar transporter subunit IIA [Alkaliphilus crotonatoxidans]
MINEFISPETIAVKVKVDCWKEAIRKAGELLLQADAIEEGYIDAMIQRVTELGPYIVIAPQVAMPHARPEDGTKRTALAMITLADGVNFGHEKNDPVRLVIALAAVDNQSHINALAKLMDLLGDNEKLNHILESKSSQALYDVLL